MWPFKDKQDKSNNVQEPQNTSKVDDAQFKDVTDAQQAEINKTSHQMEEAEIQKRMVSFLQSKGFDVTPSGTPKPGVLTNAVKTVTKTGEDAFHIGRGLIRKVKGNVEAKLSDLKNAGV